jgi:hypothetical protein
MKSHDATQKPTQVATAGKLALLTAALCAFSSASPVHAGKGNADNPGVLPPHSRPDGKTYGQWGAAWWQWAYSFPAEINPILDETGAFSGLGQSGPVWFLAGSSGATVERACTVPFGKAIFFPIINVLNDYPCPPSSNFEPAPGQSLADFLTQADDWYMNHVTALAVEVDGVALQNLREYRGTSRLFHVKADPSLESVMDPCITGTPQPAVSDGYWVMLAPLTPGHHILHFTGTYTFTLEADGFDWVSTVDVTDHLTVAPCRL